MSTSRVAIVHERFTEFGGSELVVAEFMKTWPQRRSSLPSPNRIAVGR
ncbi:Probable glycosyl transferase [Mycobacteroides abscessus]|nr:Probable glycosyl transferase [Mycobacteroides abscessus]